MSKLDQILAVEEEINFDIIAPLLNRAGFETTTGLSPAALDTTFVKLIPTPQGSIRYLLVVNKNGTAEMRWSRDGKSGAAIKKIHQEVGGKMLSEIEKDLTVSFKFKDVKSLIKEATRQYITAKKYIKDVFDQF